MHYESHQTAPSERRDEPLAECQAPAGRRGLDYRKLRELVTIRDVLRLAAWRSHRGEAVDELVGEVRGPCPIHKSSSPTSRTFSANLDSGRNVFQCHGSSCGRGGNQLDLHVALTGLDLFEASLDLCEKLGHTPPWLTPDPKATEKSSSPPELSQAEMEARFREQVRRQTCDGCGDTPIF